MCKTGMGERGGVGARGRGSAEAHIKGEIESRGEGIIIRKVNSLYEHGRSFSLLKIKVN